ncbi:shikimate kinase [Lysobacter sp. A378]
MNPAANLILVGPMGAGKSCIGARLATHFRLPLVDNDQQVEQRAGASVDAIFRSEGEPGFRSRERTTLAEVLNGDGIVLATGGGTVLDSGNRQLLRERGFVVHLHVSVAQQLARLADDKTRPLLQREDRDVALHQLALLRTPLYAQVADLRFDTGSLSIDQATTALVEQLEQHWRRAASP